MEYCFGPLCLVPFAENAPKFFGFSEFLAGLALMVLAWTTVDIRYKFRINTAPLPLQLSTFIVVATLGVLTLATDLWRAEEWLVIDDIFLTSSGWQAILGGLFLITFMTWAWFAFLQPPIFGRRNAKRYGQTLYKTILKGEATELAVIADEFSHSAKEIIDSATETRITHNKDKIKLRQLSLLYMANDILLLIGDKRFCRAIVSSSPNTALKIFQAIDDSGKYGVNISAFAKNIVSEALQNKNSFMYNEAEGFDAGLIGHVQPLSLAIFGNYKMVEGLGNLLQPKLLDKQDLDAQQWEAYCNMVLVAFRDYVINTYILSSHVISAAMRNIIKATADLYKIDEIISNLEKEEIETKLAVTLNYINMAILILEEKENQQYITWRNRRGVGHITFYDEIANMIFELITSASQVRLNYERCWRIHYRLIWNRLHCSKRMGGRSGEIISFKLRRLIYNEISLMTRYPNFKSAKILGYCLNVFGLKVKDQALFRESKAIHVAILSWTRNNFDSLYLHYPKIAENCLVDGFTYDNKQKRIIKTYPNNGIHTEPRSDYLYVATASKE